MSPQIYNNLRQHIAPVTLNLLIINFLMAAAQVLLPRLGLDFTSLLSLHYVESRDFHLWQLVTHMFLHGEVTHLFFNMFALYMFGNTIERVWSSRRFLIYYLLCGLSAAVVQEVVWYLETGLPMQGYELVSMPNGVTIAKEMYFSSLQAIGASGAIFGLLLSFGWLFPNAMIYLMFIPIPIRAKYFVIGYGVLELLLGLTGTPVHVAHFAHLGGMLGGLILMLLWRKQGTLS